MRRHKLHGERRSVRARQFLKPLVHFQPRDLWIGAYVEEQRQVLPSTIMYLQSTYVCLIPMIAIEFRVVRTYY